MKDFKTQKLIGLLKENKIKRFHLVYNQKTGKVEASHNVLQNLADFINQDTRDFEEHEGMFFQLTDKYDVLQGAFVHRTKRGQAAGGVRFWQYDNVEDFLRDGMRLGKGMTHKNAMAGLWWGGGKGVMVHNPKFDKNDKDYREYVYTEYGKLLTSLKGCYVTAEDVGTSVEDMANIYKTTRFTTCIPENLGGSGNPSEPTSRGVLSGMEAALAFLGETIEGKTVAVQGMGHVAEPLIYHLFSKNVGKVIASDINADVVKAVKERFADKNLVARVTEIGDDSILFEECDVLAPCAVGAILNDNTIPKIKARIICGAANNQLENHDKHDKALVEKGILYVPDFLTNRMGIVNCANEQYGYVNNDDFIERHLEKEWDFSVYKSTLFVLKEAKETGEGVSKVAIRQATDLSMQLHPIFGHRSQKIIDSLVAVKWFE
ncbi:MAG: Glu/Leu/Phe/Val dehydrogenase [Bacteroidales bacterium]|nr:Glu/Leu/Phe/Val dehydrogenase [Bacteroidales bacterium]